MLLSSTRGADANIYIVDLASRRERQLTAGGGLDVSPCFSPGRRAQIVFNSDRGGDQQLYIMGGRWREHPPHLLRPRPLRDAGMVAARRPDRLHPHRRRRNSPSA